MASTIVADNTTQKQPDAYAEMVKTRTALVHALAEMNKLNKQLAKAIKEREIDEQPDRTY